MAHFSIVIEFNSIDVLLNVKISIGHFTGFLPFHKILVLVPIPIQEDQDHEKKLIILKRLSKCSSVGEMSYSVT